MTMDSEALMQLYEEIDDLRIAGKEEEAKALFQKRFDELSEEAQGQLLMHMAHRAVRLEVADLKERREVQERGLEAVKILEKEKKEASKKK